MGLLKVGDLRGLFFSFEQKIYNTDAQEKKQIFLTIAEGNF